MVVKFEGDFALYKAIEFRKKYDLYLQTEVSFGNLRSRATQRKQKTRISRDVDIRSYIEERGQITLGAFPEIERKYKIRLVIWTQKNRNDQLRKSLESSIKSSNFPTLNLLSVDFNVFSSKNISNLSVILDLEDFLRTKKFDPINSVRMKESMTFAESLASKLYPNAVYANLLKKIDLIRAKWPFEDFKINQTKKFYESFGLGVQIWQKNGIKICRIFDSLYKNKLCILVESFDEKLKFDDKVVYLSNVDVLNFYSCDKKYCFFGSNDYSRYTAHMQRCTEKTRMIYKQKVYSQPCDSIKKSLVKELILPSIEYENMNYCVYDIETSMDVDKSSGVANLLYIHKLLSIAIKSNFCHENEFFLIRKTMEPECLKDLIKNFVKTLHIIRENMLLSIPGSITEGLKKYQEERQLDDFKLWLFKKC
jgi:hypothetical protein